MASGRPVGGEGARAPGTAWLALLALLPWWLYREYLSADVLWYGSDATQLHYTRYVVLGEVLRAERALPLWQHLVYAGGPFHANLENPTLYPPALVLAGLFPPFLAIHLLVLAHLSLAAVGAFLFVRRVAARLGAAAPHAAAGGLVAAAVFALNGYTRMAHFNLATYGAALALAPWVLWAVELVLHGPSARRAAGLLALLGALQVFTGGLWVIAYTALFAAAWLLGEGLLAGGEARRRALVWGPVAGALALVAVQAKVQPFLEWVALTNRGEALSLEDARGMILGVHDAYNNSGRGWPFALGLLALGWWRRRTVWLLLALAVLGLAAATGGTAHRLLWEWVPPFDRVRDARRAWVLVGISAPVLAGLGTAFLASRALAGERLRRFAPAAGALLALGLVPLLEYTWRHDLHAPESLSDVLSRYENWPAVAPVVRDEWRVEYSGDDSVLDPRGRNEQFITTVLGLETVSGYLGHAWPRALDRHIWSGFESTTSERRRKRLGVLSVRAMVVGRSDPRRGLEPPEIDGIRVDKNRWARPRVYAPPVAVGVLGDPDRDHVYAILDDPAWDPRVATVVSFDDPPSPAELAALDLVVVPSGTRLDPAVEDLLEGSDVPVTDGPGAALEAVLRSADGDSLAITGVALERPTHRSARVESPAAGAGFVVVSEPWTLYPGWSARSGDRELTLRPADGVATAVWLDADERALEARYAPRSVPRGLLLGAVGLALAALLAVRPARR